MNKNVHLDENNLNYKKQMSQIKKLNKLKL